MYTVKASKLFAYTKTKSLELVKHKIPEYASTSFVCQTTLVTVFVNLFHSQIILSYPYQTDHTSPCRSCTDLTHGLKHMLLKLTSLPQLMKKIPL